MNTTSVKRMAIAATIGSTLLLPSPAFAQANPYRDTPPASADALDAGAEKVPEAPAAQPAAEEDGNFAGSLPFTGGDVAALTVVGAALVGAGGLLLLARRRSPEAS